MRIYLSPKPISINCSSKVVGNSLGHDLTLNNGKFLNIRTQTIVEGLGPCANLMMWAGERKFVAHSAPEIEAFPYVEKKISDVIETLRNSLKHSYEDVQAFITGAIEYDSLNHVSMQSNELVEKMYEALQKFGVSTNVIAMQRGNGLNTRMGAMAHKDKIVLFGKPVEKVIEHAKTTNIKNALEKEFDFVEIPENIIISE